MAVDHSECDHPKTREARTQCRREGGGKPLSDNPKQVRRRARKHQKKMEAELTRLYKKPIEEWDMEELAHGKPRDPQGQFKGQSPKWVTRQVHEEAMRRFKQMLNAKVRVVSVPAVDVLLNLMTDNQYVYDDEGQPVRYLVPPSVKAQIGQYLIDHIVGKATQPVENKGEVMHHIQSILATSMVNPDQEPLELSHEDDDDDDEVVDVSADEDLDKLIKQRSREE